MRLGPLLQAALFAGRDEYRGREKKEEVRGKDDYFTTLGTTMSPANLS